MVRVVAIAWVLLAVANFYEKAQFVKADVAALEIVAERNGCSLPFALCFYPHFR